MSDDALLAKFAAALERAYSSKARPADSQADFDRWYPDFAKAEYDTAIQVINRVNQAKLLDALRDACLRLFFKYAANRHNVHFARSDQTFYELFARAKKISGKEHDLLGEWGARLDEAGDNPLRQRFGQLSPTWQAAVRALFPKRAASSKMLLDYLRDAFVKRKGYGPETNADLYGFDPCPDEALKARTQGMFDSVQVAWRACLAGNEDVPRIVLHGTLDAYRKYLATLARQDLLQLFQVIKYLQERLFVKRENMGGWTRISGGDNSPLTCELYAMACLQLLAFAQGVLVLPSNRQAFTREEREYFLKPLAEPRYEYFSNIADRFTRPLGNVAAAFDLSKTFLDLILLTQVQADGATLVNLGETHRLQKLWAGFSELSKKFAKADLPQLQRLLADRDNQRVVREMANLLAIEVPLGKNDLGLAWARVGASPGVHKQLGQVTIVHIDPKNHNDFYIEYEALKPNLFLVHTGYITTKVYASRIYEIHRGTAGMIYVVAGMFLMMGFMPAFVAGGFAGLISEIAIWYATSKVAEQAARIHPFFGEVLGFALQLVAPRRARFGTEVVAPEPSPRLRIVDTKAIAAPGTEGKGVRQPDAKWLDKTITGLKEPQRALDRETAAATPARPVAEPAPVPPPGGEAVRPRYKQQQVQQQQARVPPKPPPAAAPPRATTATGTRQGPARIEQWPPARHEGPGYSLYGDMAVFERTKRGYHVYEYLDEDGRLLYVGISGSVKGPKRIRWVAPGTPERPFNNWINRLRASHMSTPWIGKARKVRVSYDLSESEMYALEDMLIDANLGRGHTWNWNEKPGGFQAHVGEAGEGMGYHASARGIGADRQAVFTIEAQPFSW